MVGGGLALETPERLAELGIRGQPGQLPEGGAGTWIAAADLARAKAAGMQTLGPEEVVIRHLIHLVRRYGYEFIGIQETQVLIDGLERTHPALVREVVPKLVTPVLLADVLQAAGRGGGVGARPARDPGRPGRVGAGRARSGGPDRARPFRPAAADHRQATPGPAARCRCSCSIR